MGGDAAYDSSHVIVAHASAESVAVTLVEGERNSIILHLCQSKLFLCDKSESSGAS